MLADDTGPTVRSMWGRGVSAFPVSTLALHTALETDELLAPLGERASLPDVVKDGGGGVDF